MFQRILVATDDSELSRKAIQAAIGLASTHKAELYVLHVVPRYPTAYFEGAVVLAPDDVARVEKQWSEAGQQLVDGITREAQAAGVTAKSLLVHSDAVAEAVIAAARKQECDLIVMASHGRRGMQRVLLGSETQHVLTHSSTPVLVLR
ncbi:MULTISPECIES: universal stress protein [Ramlibacter]|uniref:Universal stress protein n=1 Tax=Ramlibacter pinisoli TaxID=2682844 RepID=A0A6N8IXD6_9BURK|nr:MULTISPECIES: universal stress protein [Ramlibacter]MBA2961564.1 universal stress protein [Ramlibacter sp. CGMCC 1.13660]MVQ31507.1 universal stress protein [Ramlibacter pinisoli]